MAVSSPSFKPVVGTGALNKKISNVSATATIETSLALTGTTKGLVIRSRNRGTLKLAFNSGESGTTYLTINKGCVYSADGIEWNGTTIYFQSDVNDVVEIQELYS